MTPIKSTPSLAAELELACKKLIATHAKEEGVLVPDDVLKAKVVKLVERAVYDLLESLPTLYSDRAVKQALFGTGGGAL